MKKIVVLFLLIVLGCSNNPVLFEDIPTKNYNIVQISRSTDRLQEILKIHSTGEFEKLDFKLNQGITSWAGVGSSRTILNNEKTKLAYISNGDLFLYDLEEDSNLNISKISEIDDSLYVPVTILISGFSCKGSKILYHLSYDNTADDEYRPPKQINYGFYVYDIEANKNFKIDIPNQFIGWLNEEELLLNTQDLISKHFIYNIFDNTTRLILDMGLQFRQECLSSNGRKFLAMTSFESKRHIVEVDVFGNLLDVKYSFNFQESIAQRPLYSPDNKNFCFWSIDRNSKKYQFYINGEKIIEQDRGFLYYWINNSVIAILVSIDNIKIYDYEKKEFINSIFI